MLSSIARVACGEGCLLTEPTKLETVGKYRILSKIGQGAMGEVHRALDPVLKRQVAIKTLSALHAIDDDLVQRFQREAQSAAGLNHPNIITVYDFGEERGVFYLVMELLDGSDLKDLLARRTMTDLPTQLDFMEQVSEGLAFAHRHGVIHRDLKPANLRILPGGRVKIMDFGLARMQTSEMTRTGTVLGTPNYMAPEQVRGERADTRSDVFSLGAVFYELVSGRKAFHAESLHGILFKVLEEQPTPVLQAAAALPPSLAVLIEKSLQKNPDDRYQNAGEVRAAVRALREAAATGSSDPTMVFSQGRAKPPGSAAATVISPSPAMVTGATALDLSRLPAASSTGAPTLSGQAPTKMGRAEAAPTAPSRLPLILGAAGLVVVLGVAGGLAVHNWWPRVPPTTTPPGDAAREQEQILTEQLVGSQVELGRVDLENKDYAGAIRQAERALQIDPGNAAAKALVQTAKGRIEELDAAAAQARAAFSRGDTEGASRALTKVLSLDPRHPVAAELSAALNQHFRRQAEDARRSALVSRDQAAALKAQGTEGFSHAQRLGQEAEALLGDQQFAVATQKFLESRDAYERARRAAEIAARPTPRPVVVVNNPPPIGPGFPPVSLPPATVPTGPAATLPATLAPSNPGTAAQDGAIRRLLADYSRAIEAKDLTLFREVKPNLTAAEEKRLSDAFKVVKSQKVAITIESMQVDGGQANVRVSRQQTIDGKPLPPIRQTFHLVQAGGAWKIDSIGQ